jgi:hypothetical protein
MRKIWCGRDLDVINLVAIKLGLLEEVGCDHRVALPQYINSGLASKPELVGDLKRGVRWREGSKIMIINTGFTVQTTTPPAS